MPALSNTWTTKTIKITYRNPLTLVKESGSFVLETTGRVTNTLDDGSRQVFRPGRISQGNLNIVEGVPSLQVDVPVVDDPDNTPQGGSVRLTVSFNGGGNEVFTLYPLSTWQPITDVGNLLDPGITPGVATYVIKGVPGGVAALDADGDVVDADGIKVIASGAGGSPILNVEQIQDIVGDMFQSGTNASVIYDDATGKITVSASGGNSTSYTDEQVRDVIGTALKSSGYIAITVDDAGDGITISGSTSLDNALSNRLRTDVTQNLTTIQKNQVKTSIALDQVDNTSDVNKPISTAQQQALDLRLRMDTAQSLTAPQKAQVKSNIDVPVLLVPMVTRTAAQGVPTAAQCAAAGYPDGTLIFVDGV